VERVARFDRLGKHHDALAMNRRDPLFLAKLNGRFGLGAFLHPDPRDLGLNGLMNGLFRLVGRDPQVSLRPQALSSLLALSLGIFIEIHYRNIIPFGPSSLSMLNPETGVFREARTKASFFWAMNSSTIAREVMFFLLTKRLFPVSPVLRIGVKTMCYCAYI